MSNFALDKNKSAYKLQGFAPVLWINCDKDEHRKEFMENQFEYWNIKNQTRIVGIDAREDEDVTQYIKGRVPDNLSPGELGCCMSHLKAIKYFLDETDYDRVLIMEDDVDFSTVKFWNFSWNDLVSYLPHDYDCMQFTVINPAIVHITMHPRFINDFSAACYLITRHHAEKIVRLHCRGGYTGKQTYKLDNGVQPRATSEDCILYSGKTYVFPIFLFSMEHGSAIHDEHLDIFHKNSFNGVNEFWTTSGSQVSIDQLMKYEPYMYGLPPGFDVNGPIPRADEQKEGA
tara:strand:- start:129 stop:989 length:861 start_codon:yes stop_codon:yes gene_type:complete